jgi:uncharacterized membrane protein
MFFLGFILAILGVLIAFGITQMKTKKYSQQRKEQ